MPIVKAVDSAAQEIKMSSAWITTYTGKRFYPLDPNPEDIDIIDIAHSLSNLCRFNGHVKSFYSVAQHSVIVSYHCNKENALYGLTHDASEGLGLNDFPAPIKQLPEFEFYRQAEHKLQSMIYKKFGLDPTEPPDVKEADLRTRVTEIRDLMPPEAAKWNNNCQPFDFTIKPMSPKEAEQLFLERFKELTK